MSEKILIFGGSTGWIGQKMVSLSLEQGHKIQIALSRLENREQVSAELDEFKPTIVLNCAGLTGRPNVDWCEDNKQETVRVNVIGTLNLLDLCYMKNIHVTNYATGCIYEYDNEHVIGCGNNFTEEDEPNFDKSWYSKTKAYVDQIAKIYPNVLTLRIRMPISDDLNPRSFITKITNYAKVVNIPNSMTILHELLPISLDMSIKRLVGTFNFTNPGAISHNEILELYKNYINKDFTWVNFSLEEQSQILKAGRSNNELDVSKLLSYYPNIEEVHVAMEKVFQRMSSN